LSVSNFFALDAWTFAHGSVTVALSEDPLLVWNYGTMGVIAGVAGMLFWISVRKLDAQEDVLNNLDEGHVDRHLQ
jgi:POT family proton-dependent oligopeptide transporter